MVNFKDIFYGLIKGNSTEDYLIALGIFIGIFILLKLFDFCLVYVLKYVSKKRKNILSDTVINFLEAITLPFFIYISIYLASLTLILPEFLNEILKYFLIIFIIYYIAKGIINISSYALEEYKEKRKKKNKSTSDSMIKVMKILFKIVIWSLAFLMVLSNFGINITPLIASLGIAGIAVGLALQNILGDLFSAFAIYFDKPFEEGDFIILGKDMGVIKNIGIKTTRIQALGGQELIVGNSEMTSTRINNYKKMDKRRIAFSFGVEYKTPVTKLKKIKKIVENVAKQTKHVTLDRVHFREFGDSSLVYEVVYYIDTNDYNVYMDVQEKINLKIKELIEKEGVNFAFPTQTVYIVK